MPDFQTLSSIRKELSGRNLRPATGLGQHFLIDGNLLRLMVEEAAVVAGDLVLEVGCGTGSLTQLLAARAGHVIAVEVDERLLDIAREALRGCPNVTFWQGDVLARKHALAPQLADLISQQLGEHPDRCFKMVSDLPYQVATPVIMNLLESELAPELMLVTVQRELAEKLTAQPGTRPYGAVTVKVAVRAEAKVLRLLRPSVFWPRPAVESAFVRLRRREEPLVSPTEYPGFARLVDTLFRHRRKTLGRGLAILGRELGWGKEEPPAFTTPRWAAQRIDQLTAEDLLSLWQTLRGRVATGELSA
jgi:16S rRNA (adenine1518-N6/adenine1519-N6)-dimethyltransferase